MNKETLKSLKDLMKLAIKEDIGKGDITTEAIVSKKANAVATIVAKDAGRICGIDVVNEFFKFYDKKIDVKCLKKDGEVILVGDEVIRLEGNARSILSVERIVLNFLQRLSGVTTKTKQYVDIISEYKVKLLDTRKTIPGFRLLEKYAVKTGGGKNHRKGLYDMFLIKDNHIEAAGSIKKAVKAVKKKKMKIEVETKSLDQVKEAVKEDVNMIMLDNMSIDEIEIAVKMIREANKKIKIEASGGININNIEEIAKCGVDFISVGTDLTLSAKALDFSLNIEVR